MFPLTVPFNVTSVDDNATSWNWDFGDGTKFNTSTSNLRNATHIYSSGGTYTVRLLTNNTWDTNTTTLTGYVVVYNQTISGFTANPHAGRFPLTVPFNVTRVDDNATMWNWSFGDGTWFNITLPFLRNATHKYSTGGTYTVIQITANAYTSNTTTLEGYVVVWNRAVSGFTADPHTGLTPLTVRFNVTRVDDNATMWNWTFGDGTSSNGTTQNVTHIYLVNGTYTISETAINKLYSLPNWSQVAAQLNSQVTIPSLTTYNDGSGEAIFGGTGITGRLFKYNTSLGNWTQVAAQLNSQEFIQSLTTYNDGTGNAIFGGTGTNGLLFKYNTSLGGWTQVAAQLNSQTIIDSLTTYNDGTGEAIFGGTGGGGRLFKYNTSLGGWSQVAAQLNSQSGIFSLTTYDDGTGNAIFGGTSANGLLFKYNASLGGWSQVAAQLNSQSGIFSLTTYDDGTGNAIFGGTSANGLLFKYNASLGGWSQVAAQINSQNSISSLTTYNDGTGKAIFGGTETGGRLFKYNVSLGAWTEVAAQLNSQNSISALTTYSSGEAIFGGTAAGGGRLFKYGSSPVVSINTTVLTDYINVFNNTFSGFTADPHAGMFPLTVPFNATTMDDNATMWNWSFGDDTWYNTSDSASRNATHIYSTGGTYTVIQIAANAWTSNTTTLTDYVVVYNTTVSGFTTDPHAGLFPLTVPFNVTSVDDNATMWNWSFGDGTWYNTSVSASRNATHIYSSGGAYTVSQISANPWDSNTTTLDDYVIVYNHTYANYTANVTWGHIPLVVQFTDLSGNATAWSWAFGDGGTSNDQNPLHVYETAGIYQVILVASGDVDTNASMRLLIQAAIYNITTPTPTPTPTPIPSVFQAQFVGNPTFGSEPLTVGFTDLSTGYPTSWNWSFGDGNYSEVQNPTHEYAYTGIFTVALNASNTDYTNITEKVNYITVSAVTPTPTPSPLQAEFVGAPTFGSNPLMVSFTDLSIGSPTAWCWSFGDGSYSDVQNPVHQYTSETTFTVSLNASTVDYYDIKTKVNYVTVSSGTPTPVPTAPIPTATPQPLNVKEIRTEVGETWIKWSWTWNSSESTPMIYLDGVLVQNTTGNQIIATNLEPRSGHTLEIYTNEGRGFVVKKDIMTLPSTFDIELYFVISIVIIVFGLFVMKDPEFRIVFAAVGLVIALYALNIAYGVWLFLPALPAIFAGIVIIFNIKEIISRSGAGKW
jgi:PKD repeat protein